MTATHVDHPAATSEELRHILRDIDDARTLEILALDPTVADLEEALLWAEGDSEALAKSGRPLTGIAAKVYDILIRDEEPARMR